MPLVNQTQFAAHKAAIRDWVSFATGFASGKVIWVNNLIERPANPFASLQITSKGIKTGLDVIQQFQNGNVIEEHIVGQREMVIQLEVYADPVALLATEGAFEVLEKALMALEMRQIREAFKLVNLAQMSYESLDLGDAVIEDRWEARALADIRFSYRTILFDDGTDDDSTYIETVDPITEAAGTATWDQ